MSEVTDILRAVQPDGEAATAQIFPIVYQELKRLAAKKLASERIDHTLQATGLVHEVYLRLMNARQQPRWQNRGHFFAAAAEAMRRILIDWARHKAATRCGGKMQKRDPACLDLATDGTYDADLLLDIEAGLTRLAAEDSAAAEFAKLRLFAGLSVSEAGELLNMSRSAAYETWSFVRAWFTVHVGDTDAL